MPLDISLFRQDAGIVCQSQRARFESEKLVSEVLALDTRWRKARSALDDRCRERARLQTEITKRFKATDDGAGNDEHRHACLQTLRTLKSAIATTKKALDTLEESRAVLISRVGNIVHKSVPISDDEGDSVVVRKWGKINPATGTEEHHHTLLWRIGGYEPLRGAKIAGHRGYFLTGPGVLLNLALQNYGLAFLAERGYTPVQPPYFMKKEVMAQTAQLSQFDEELYHVGEEKGGEENKYYLIATSEQPLSAMHRQEWLLPAQLPIKYAGTSTCFRKEAGAYGRDAWGIFRVHQFEKIEQFLLCEPGASWDFHEEMIRNAESFYRSLDLPHRVVNIVSGALNNACAKKYDLEGWFPTLRRYMEFVLCSNCTDYQSRALGIRCGAKTGTGKTYVHMLNSTLCATTRTITCILENYQTADGVVVPEVLRPYCGVDFFPFVQDA